MKILPAHLTPRFSEEVCEDALLHYSTGAGLLGILRNNELWSTAYYCASDESELKAGEDILTPIFRSKTSEMIEKNDRRVNIFSGRGVDVRDYAAKFEQTVLSLALSKLCVYITCFCKPNGEEDFQHGLLSQWRGYGQDGGYALQFSRKKLQERIEQANKDRQLDYELQDVHYSPDNPLKEEVMEHSDKFASAYVKHLDALADFSFDKKAIRNPIAGLTRGPLESLLDYIIHTKSSHFSEENESRLSILGSVSGSSGLPVDYFNRRGLVVPFVRTPAGFNLLDCIDWIIVGPGPRIENRLNSVRQMISRLGPEIRVRPSHIPFTRA